MSNSIGAALRAARERRKLTLTQVSEATRIRPPFLQALENDDLSAMTSSAQARGFMRIYAELLELDLEALITAAQPAPAPASAAAAEAPLPARGQDSDQEGKASHSGVFARLRQRLSNRVPGEAPGEAGGTPASEASAAASASPVPEPKAKVSAPGKKKAGV